MLVTGEGLSGASPLHGYASEALGRKHTAASLALSFWCGQTATLSSPCAFIQLKNFNALFHDQSHVASKTPPPPLGPPLFVQAFEERDAFLAHKAAVEAAAEENERIRADIHNALDAQTRAEADRHAALAAAAAAQAAQRQAEEARSVAGVAWVSGQAVACGLAIYCC